MKSKITTKSIPLRLKLFNGLTFISEKQNIIKMSFFQKNNNNLVLDPVMLWNHEDEVMY